MGRLHLYALKLPLPPKTGRELEDDDNAARHEQLKWLVSELLRDTTHVAACCNTLSRRLALKEEQIESGSSEQFDSITTVNALNNDWLVMVVERLSDLTTQDVVAARGKGEEAPKLLFTIATQLPWQLKLPACLKVKEVALRVVLKIEQMQGTRLASFKRIGHLRSDGRLDLSGVCYTPYFNEQRKLVKVKHQSGAEANAEKYPMTTCWILTDNHSDWAAAMQMKPMPKVPLHTLFAESQTGPYNVPPWTNKKGTQRFADLCAEVYKDFEDERAKLSAGDKTAEEVKEALATLDSARRRASMDKARLKAQETLQAKRQRRTIVLDSKAGAASGSVAPA